jgi:Protein of unknown function (DUF3619)
MNIQNQLRNSARITGAETQGLESRLAMHFAGALSARVEQLPHDVAERLRFAREQALGKARDARRLAPAAAAAAVSVVGTSARGAASLGGFVPWWQRAASMLPLVMLVAGMFMIEHWTAREQAFAAADIDAQLLADDLPPAAYGDPGFAEYLRSAPTP